jgi:hypothetical protein
MAEEEKVIEKMKSYFKGKKFEYGGFELEGITVAVDEDFLILHVKVLKYGELRHEMEIVGALKSIIGKMEYFNSNKICKVLVC